MTEFNTLAVIAITILGGIGLTLLFFFSLFIIVHAFGKNRKAWGIVCILLLPLSAVYSLVHWNETQYPRRYLFLGTFLMLLTFIAYLFL